MAPSTPPFWHRHTRHFVATTAVLATLATLAACGSSEASGGGADEITLFLIPSPTADAIESRIPEFEEETGVSVKVVDAPYNDAHQKMLLSFQARPGAYDVVQFDNPYLAPFAAQGALADLEPYTSASEAYAIDDFVEPLQDYNKYDDVPVALNLSTEPFILWYRTDLYEELGLEVPTTWEEYLANAQACQDSGLAAGQIIANDSTVNSWWWLQLVWSFGGDLQDESGEVVVDSPEAVEATDYMKSLLAVSPDSAVTATGDDATTLFSTQDVCQMINYSGYYPVVTDPESSTVIDKFATAEIPTGAADITQLTGWNIGIPEDSKSKDAAWQFLEWLLSKENTPKLMDAGAAAIGRTSIVTDQTVTDEQPYVALLGPAAETGRRLPALTTWGQASNQIGVAVADILTDATSTTDGLADLKSELQSTLGE